jgi:[histone H3]-trimethyl-L-lysine4 demethylase
MDDDNAVNGDADAGRRSKRLKKDGAPTVTGSHMTQPRLAAPRQLPPRGPNEKPGTRCESCGEPGNAYSLALCDGCEHGYHPQCIDPPLRSIPQSDWFCPRCLVGSGDFGFEEGGTYSLKQFQHRAQIFKDGHFASKQAYDPILNMKRPVTEDEVEREFWRLTESLTETVEVEYGADIHTHVSGSAFPTMEKNPRDPYACDPWNLNNLPLDKSSLFRHIKTDISGMTVPWLYVGMCFSCFCWHAEDHNTYSANYQHFGATKTWYGVPAADAEKLENAMREAVPELFESNPDLLYQLTTLVTPDRFRKAGVNVYALDQRAGQFVITFPQAYHAGFNHGFNFNEAVNFAPADWEPHGEEAVRKLRMFRRQPVFCHDELLLSAASRDETIKTARWLGPALERMLDEEARVRLEYIKAHKATREHTCPLDEPPAADAQCDLAVQKYPEDVSDDDCVCAFCKSFSYLSRYVCKRTDKVICLEHAGVYECCDMSAEERFSASGGHHVLQLRYKDAELKKIFEDVMNLAEAPEIWTEELNMVLDAREFPSLKSLRTIVQAGERMNLQWELKELPDLRKFVERCNEWVEEATNYTTRKQQNRRKNERAWRKASVAKAAEQEERDKELRSVDNMKKLIRSAEDIGFDCPEIILLREKAENIASFQQQARDVMGKPHSKNVSELEDLAELGRSYNVDLPEVDQLEKLVKQLQWYDQCAERQKPGKIGTLQEVSDLIQQGLDLDIPDTDSFIMGFKEKKGLGEFWEAKAKEIMEAENVHYQQLDALSTQAADLPVSHETRTKVDAILKKQRDAQEQIMSLFEASKMPDLRQRPTYKEVKDAMEALNELSGRPPGALDLEKEQKRHEDWMRRGKKLFGKANAPLHILLQHMQWVEQRNEGCFDLRDTPRMPVEPSSRANSPNEDHEQDLSSDPNRDVFCICRKPEAGMMIECEICHEW